MHVDAERLLDKDLQDNPFLRAEWEQNQKLRDDPRVTRVGRLLRKTLAQDEPGRACAAVERPMRRDEPHRASIHRGRGSTQVRKNYKLYRRIKPGISGLWQVSGRSDTGYEERVAMDAYYVRNWSIWLDFIFLARTVKIGTLV
jgi:lipopolysaccharide/colanic/teichoic acid biosynthesis glycosyltransferase